MLLQLLFTIAIIISFVMLIFLILQVGSIIFTFPPSITSANKVIDLIIKEIANDKDLKYFYDMGSGNGTLCYKISRKFPKLKVIGYEKFYLAYLWAKFFRKGANLSFICQDITDTQFKEPGFIYFFQLSGYIDTLFKEMKKNIIPGSLLISYNAEIKDLSPSKILEFNDFFVKRKIFFYKINN